MRPTRMRQPSGPCRAYAAGLPPLAELIEGGRVLALNMPAGANPALGRAIGVLLKNAWMQALLRWPAEAARRPGRYLRPAVFICDEYQAFATVGQDDPRWRREGVRADAAVPLHPDRCHAVDLLAPLRAVGHGGLAHTGPDAPHPDLPVLERRVLGQDRGAVQTKPLACGACSADGLGSVLVPRFGTVPVHRHQAWQACIPSPSVFTSNPHRRVEVPDGLFESSVCHRTVTP